MQIHEELTLQLLLIAASYTFRGQAHSISSLLFWLGPQNGYVADLLSEAWTDVSLSLYLYCTISIMIM